MQKVNPSRLAWISFAVAAALGAAALVFLALSWREPVAPGSFGFRGFALLFVVVFGVVGVLIASRRPENPIGWLFLASAVLSGVQELAQDYAYFAYARGGLPFGAFAAWIPAWIWLPGTGMLIFALLLFPSGHLLSSAWRWVLWLAIVGAALGTVALALQPGPLENFAYLNNPFGIGTGVSRQLGGVGLLPYGIAFAAAAVSLVIRYRRSTGDERAQLKWLAVSGLVLAFVLIVSLLANVVTTSPTTYLWISVAVIGAFFSVPVATGIAILKYRLYDIDVVLKKTVVFAIVVVVLTGIYLAAIALTAGGLIGGLLIAFTFRPVRNGARRVADRLVYGKRATPYEVLADFGGKIGDTYATNDVLPRMAQLLREATGADVARVWLSVAGSLRPVASAPSGAEPAGALPPDAAQVRYHGDVLGALSVQMPASDPLDPTREKLVHDLAAQAGPVLSNVRLIEELKASRRRIVTAQDERAKKLERDIHDGAQQQLVALAVKLKLAEQTIDRDPERSKTMLETLQSDAHEALENLRNLARGIYPPLLADKGLAVALEAQARKAPLPVTVEADGVGRLAQDVEAAVYFSCLEALQNVGKYAQASRATIKLSSGDGELSFLVVDDGRGFDPSATAYGTGLQGIADRLAALGGELGVTSEPGTGTTITGRVPS